MEEVLLLPVARIFPSLSLPLHSNAVRHRSKLYIVHQSNSRVSMAKAHSLFTYKYNDAGASLLDSFSKHFFFHPFFYFKDLRTAHVLFIIANKCIAKCIQLRDKKKTGGKHSAT